jgi:excisionase family DNA binding protein
MIRKSELTPEAKPHPGRSSLLSIQEAAAALGVSEQWLRQLARLGRVRGARKVGRDWVIPSPPRVLPSTRPRGYHGHNRGAAPSTTPD